ncbi:MAG: YqaA family protein [Lysobacterales bacterium]
MRLFAPLYERALRWSAHRQAPRLLGLLSFSEAIFFPVPPETMLAPMTLAAPRHWALFAGISLFWSTLGALVGYAIGHFAADALQPLMLQFGYGERFAEIERMAAEQGFWLLLIGGFTPVPFKLLTLASGAVSMPMLPFLAGAIVGRGKRVFLVAGLIRIGGERAEAWLRAHVEHLGMLVLMLIVLLFLAWYGWPT